MTTMITEVYEAFKEANVSDAKAIAAATAIPTKNNLATKEDLLEVRSELKEDLLEVRSELKEDLLEVRSELKEDLLEVRNELKEEIGGVRQDMTKLEARLTEKMNSLDTQLDKRIDQVRFDLREDILKLENKIILWMGSMLVVAVGVLAVLMKIL